MMSFLLLLSTLLFSLVQSIVEVNLENNVCSNLLVYNTAAFSSKCRYNPDVLSDTISMAIRHGYNAKTYSTVTNDGYILNLYRINSKSAPVGNPVLLIAGIAIDSESWINTGNRSLAFNFANRGYDVWVGTLRGTINSNEHVNLSINDPKYWNYNVDTLAAKDFDAQLNFVADVTGKKILVVGHSMGTSISFMYASEYHQRSIRLIEAIIALAPVAYLGGLTWTKYAEPVVTFAIDFLDALNIKGILYQEDFIHNLEIQVCKIWSSLCYFLITTLNGKTNQFAPDDMPVFLSSWPSGTSVYLIKHYKQIVLSNKFQKYDYGKSGNEEMYGFEEPPTYNLTNIKVPVFLFYGENDIYYKAENLERLYNELGSTTKYKLSVPVNVSSSENLFSHIDFLYSKNLKKYLYEDIFQALDLHLRKNKNV